MIKRNIYVNLMITYTFKENALVCEQTLCTNFLRKSMEICVENFMYLRYWGLKGLKV